jgi:NAD(P)-dependent dehydrogenase (short-subunit alcohol dehydrogenase family)
MPTALIWGAKGGIGSALARTLVDTGWQVIAFSRQAPGITAPGVCHFDANVEDEYSVQQAVFQAAQEIEHADLFIYAAGDIASVPVRDLSVSCWQRIINANLSGAFITTRYSLPLLSDEATLIFLGGRSERLRLPGLAAYASAKAGLEAYTEALGKELRTHKILLIRPSAVDTPLWEKVPLRLPKNAVSPESMAVKIWEAYQAQQSGSLDL